MSRHTPGTLHAIIPVKPFEEGKRRLARLLPAAERVALNRQLCLQTLDRAAVYPGAAHSTVVSRSAAVLALARERGFRTLAEPPPFGLNAAVRLASWEARAAGAEAIVVLPVDLPHGGARALRQLVESAPAAPVCVLVPDQHGKGTNLLFQSPITLLDYAFGDDSLGKHRRLAQREGLLPVVRADSAFNFDIDEPADYQRWRALGPVL